MEKGKPESAMGEWEKERASAGRCLALYPGAFRPPHKAHLLAVQDLAVRPEVDEVVVIITNRLRDVPGTTKVLDCDLAEKIWKLYLKEVAKARVEIAPDSAVKAALGYFERVGPDDRLIFSVGESDFSSGDTRFRKIQKLSEETGVAAEVLPAPTGGIAVRATEMRAALGRGEAGFATFTRALPDHLGEAERRQVWEIAQDSLREAGAARLERLRLALKTAGYGTIGNLSPACGGQGKGGQGDETLRFRAAAGAGEEVLYAKYAKDTVEAARLDKPGSLKPRGRLSAERRAIKYLRRRKIPGLLLPEVRHFDKEAKLLVFSEVCPNGQSLEAELRAGRFEREKARKTGSLLAELHRDPGPNRPFWGSAEAEEDHWRALLGRRCGKALAAGVPGTLGPLLKTLEQTSDDSRMRGFLHLDYQPKNILVEGEEIGLIDLEFACSIGDRALDLGWLLGHYFHWGFVPGCSKDAAAEAGQDLIEAYKTACPENWPSLQGRVTAFAGACLAVEFGAEADGDHICKAAEFLLRRGLQEELAPEKALREIMAP
jgi:aminoglycoside phosphotransferase (APT) family kinase protein/nicotinic acid mononucleotide adenylyltransferase